MTKKVISGILLTLLLIGMSTFAFNIQPVKASEIIYIRADGSIDPPTASISSVDNVTYCFTGDNYAEIVVERSDIIIDGNGYILQGFGNGKGFDLTSIHNVTIQNMDIQIFDLGIYLDSSSNNTVSGNTITNNNWYGVWFYSSSNDNTVSGNTITDNDYGVRLWSSSNNNVSGNTITNNGDGVYLDSSSNNTVSGNTIANNNWYGVWFYSSSNDNTVSGNTMTNNSYGVRLWSSSDNRIYHNSFINNIWQWETYDSINTWDDGYPSGGNYWSDFTASKDEKSGPDQDLPGSDGIWDDWNIIDENNRDRYSLTNPPHDVTIKAHCYTEIMDISVDITMDGSLTGYTTPHTFLGLTVFHTFTVPNMDPNDHYFRKWSTDENTTTITVKSAGTFTAYYQARCNLTIEPTTGGTTDPPNGTYTYWHGYVKNVTAIPADNHVLDHWVLDGENESATESISVTMNTDHTLRAFFVLGTHDVAIIDAKFNKTVVCKNYTAYFRVIVENQGEISETFGVAVPYNESVVLPISEQWYEFWSMGDVNRDGYIDSIDQGLINDASGSTPGEPHWNPDADVNQDGIVDHYDQAICNGNIGKKIWTHFNLTLTLPPRGTQRGVRLDPGNQKMLNFTLDATFWDKGNYTLAYATSVLGETDLTDNIYGDGWVVVAIKGDVNGDGLVDIFDKTIVGAAFGAVYNATDGMYWHGPPDYPGPCPYCPHPPEADINNDGVVDIYDKVPVGANFGKEDP